MKLIIFDLDQTLVDFISAHEETIRTIFKKTFNLDAGLKEIDFAGKSLRDVIHDLARQRNIPEDEIQQKSKQLLKSYDTVFSRLLPPDGVNYILPGVVELLDELMKTEHLVVLYTGDSPAIVRAVFRSTGVGKYFRFCQYGTRVKARADMVRLALKKAKKISGREFKKKDIVIIGDSTRDIDCGKIFGAVTISVATGFHSWVQLLTKNPDYLFPSLKDYRNVLKTIEQS